MRFTTDGNLWWRRREAAFGGLLLLLSLASFAHSQVAVRDLCASVEQTPRFASSEGATSGADDQDGEKSAGLEDDGSAKVDKQGGTKLESTQSTTAFEVAKIDRCVRPSPFGVRYNPQVTAFIRRQYEKSLSYAKGLKKEEIISHVDLDVTVGRTTPSGYFYREGDSVRGGPYETIEQCRQIERKPKARGVCGPNEGPVFISLTGSIRNWNRFPLGSASIQCEYLDEKAVAQSVMQHFEYTLAPDGGYIPLQDAVIGQLPPHSENDNISCKVAEVEIWKSFDGIQYLNAPLNPTFRTLPTPTVGGQ